MKNFLLYLVVEILQLVHEGSIFPGVLYKRGDQKSFSIFTDKHKKQSPVGVLVFCQKMFLKILQNSQKSVFAGVSFSIELQAENLKLSKAVTGDVL